MLKCKEEGSTAGFELKSRSIGKVKSKSEPKSLSFVSEGGQEDICDHSGGLLA